MSDVSGKSASGKKRRPGFIYNHDDSCWYAGKYTRIAGDGAAGLRKLVDIYADGNMTELSLCVNSQCATFDSQVVSPYGWNLAESEESTQGQSTGRDSWIDVCAKDYIARGIDANAVMLDQCRKRKIRSWISIRMNDCHLTFDTSHPIHSRFWVERKDLWCIPNDSRENGNLCDRALDYSQKDVRDYFTAFVRECLERYDCDGIELDFMRFPRVFPSGTERNNAHHLTDFLRDVRRLTESASAARGRRISLAVRIESRPENALSSGKDYLAWAREGLVDRIIVSNFWTSVDFEIPLSQWKAEIGSINPEVEVIPGMDGGAVDIAPDGTKERRHLLSFGEYAAFIDRMVKQGAESIYFFNLFDIKPESGVWEKLVLGDIDPETIENGARGVKCTSFHD